MVIKFEPVRCVDRIDIAIKTKYFPLIKKKFDEVFNFNAVYHVPSFTIWDYSCCGSQIQLLKSSNHIHRNYTVHVMNPTEDAINALYSVLNDFYSVKLMSSGNYSPNITVSHIEFAFDIYPEDAYDLPILFKLINFYFYKPYTRGDHRVKTIFNTKYYATDGDTRESQVGFCVYQKTEMEKSFCRIELRLNGPATKRLKLHWAPNLGDKIFTFDVGDALQFRGGILRERFVAAARRAIPGSNFKKKVQAGLASAYIRTGYSGRTMSTEEQLSNLKYYTRINPSIAKLYPRKNEFFPLMGEFLEGVKKGCIFVDDATIRSINALEVQGEL